MSLGNEVVAYSGGQQLSWQVVGTIDATAGNADAVLDETERDYASAILLANSVAIVSGTDALAAEIRVIFATDGADAIFDIWTMRENGLYMTRICTITAKAGKQYANAAGSLVFADTLTISNEVWYTALAGIHNGGVDHIARVIFNKHGHKTFLFHGHTTFDEDAVIEMAGT